MLLFRPEVKHVTKEILELKETIEDPVGTVADALAFLSENSADRDGQVPLAVFPGSQQRRQARAFPLRGVPSS